MNKPRARIVIADHHKLVAEALKRLVEPEFEVVGVVSHGRRLVQLAHELMPTLVMLDICLQNSNGLDAGPEIKKRNSLVKLLYLTTISTADVAVEAFRCGVGGYLVKECSVEELRLAIRLILEGKSYLTPAITKDLVELLLRLHDHDRERRIASRNAETLQLLVKGKQMKEIGCILQITRGTVAFHKYKMMKRLGIMRSAGLIDYAVKHYLV